MENIDALINKISYEIVSEKILSETEINKLLSVLSNHGVYAMWVYALDKIGITFYEEADKLKNQKIFLFLSKISELDQFITKNFNFEKFINEICKLTEEINKLTKEIKLLKENLNNKLEKQQKEKKLKEKEKERIDKFNEYFINISQDLHKLLFLKQLLEKILIYARYHAKSLSD